MSDRRSFLGSEIRGIDEISELVNPKNVPLSESCQNYDMMMCESSKNTAIKKTTVLWIVKLIFYFSRGISWWPLLIIISKFIYETKLKEKALWVKSTITSNWSRQEKKVCSDKKCLDNRYIIVSSSLKFKNLINWFNLILQVDQCFKLYAFLLLWFSSWFDLR